LNLFTSHIGAVQTADEPISGESKWVLAWSKEEKRRGKITLGVGAVHRTHTKRNEDRDVHRDRLTSKSQQPRSDISYEWDPLTMDYFDNLNNKSLNKYKKILKIKKSL
jgi:hypothetical protein